MKRFIILIAFYMLYPTHSNASFYIFLENNVYPQAKTTKTQPYKCDVIVRFDSEDMSKISLAYSENQDPCIPIFSTLKQPDTVLVQLIHPNDMGEHVEQIISYEKKDIKWVTRTYQVLANWGKCEYKVCHDYMSAEMPTSLNIHVQQTEDFRSQLLISHGK
jgi:hypothetical protein